MLLMFATFKGDVRKPPVTTVFKKLLDSKGGKEMSP